MSDLILAAGVVIYRDAKDNEIEIAIIHRPKYDDWSFPKGKLEIGESLIACAYREVLEETNIQTQFGPFLGEVNYTTAEGEKNVSYWSAKAIAQTPFHANAEVDQLKWVAVKKVAELLTLKSDKKIFDIFLKVTPHSSPLILLRHAKAISRDEWQGDEDDRPLDSLGQLQAKRFLSTYQVFNLQQIHTSDAIRCYDSVDLLAKSLDIKLEVTNKLSESSYRRDKEKAIDYVKELIKTQSPTLICSHNPILPKMLNKLTKKSEVESDDEKLLPAAAWVIHHIGKEIVAVDRISSPSF